eukprot:9710174-Alexandrium_andersonii.AAC.1
MSASLVGSEMCIRDSASAARPGRPLAALHKGRGLTASGAPMRARGPATTCLLYTSDAADDM